MKPLLVLSLGVLSTLPVFAANDRADGPRRTQTARVEPALAATQAAEKDCPPPEPPKPAPKPTGNPREQPKRHARPEHLFV